MRTDITIDQLMQMANRVPLDRVDEESSLTWCQSVASKLSGYNWEVVESGADGMATFVEIMIGPPSNALSLRKSLLGPFAAIGKGSYSLARPGEVTAFTPMALNTVGEYDSNLSDVARAVVDAAKRKNICLLSKDQLSEPIPSHVSSEIMSSLPALENRHVNVFYDVVFQWED